MKVFIGGSIGITRLNADIHARLDDFIRRGNSIEGGADWRRRGDAAPSALRVCGSRYWPKVSNLDSMVCAHEDGVRSTPSHVGRPSDVNVC